MSSPHIRWDEVNAWRANSPAYRRYEDRINRNLDDFWRGQEAGLTRRMVEVSTKKYRARKGRKK